MAKSKNNRTGIYKLLAVVIIGALLLLIFRSDLFKKTSSTGGENTPSQTSEATTGNSNGPLIDTSLFNYVQPAGWNTIPEQSLKDQAAISGIAAASSPNAQFSVAAEAAATSPSSHSSLVNETLSVINRFQNFELISNTATKIDGHDAQQFVYKFGDKDKTRQQLTVLLYKGRAFSLLITAPDNSFESQKTTFDQIISSFKFK